MEINYDLGSKNSGPSLASEVMKSDEKRYPCLYIEGEGKLELPESGEMTVKFRRTSRSETEREDGKETYCLTLEIREIISVDGGEVIAPTKKHSDAGEALDALLKAAMHGRGESDRESDY